MPIFMDTYEEDQRLIEMMAKEVAEFWNKYGGTEYGFQVFVSKECIVKMSEDGDAVLAAHFHDEPGPFKRIAAALVLARLTPLFGICSVNSTDDRLAKVPIMTLRDWVPRLAFLLIEPALAAVQLVGMPPQASLRDGWHGFPSLHSKAEFLLWLEWLCDYPTELLASEPEQLARRGRMVLATALILESIYYQDGRPPAICGCCDKEFAKKCDNLGLFTFDKMLAENYRAINRTPD